MIISDSRKEYNINVNVSILNPLMGVYFWRKTANQRLQSIFNFRCHQDIRNVNPNPPNYLASKYSKILWPFQIQYEQQKKNIAFFHRKQGIGLKNQRQESTLIKLLFLCLFICCWSHFLTHTITYFGVIITQVFLFQRWHNLNSSWFSSAFRNKT